MGYIIGIDLGTTNSSLAYVDLSSGKGEKLPIQPFLIPQLTSQGVQELAYLPSCCFLWPKGESNPCKLPWENPHGHLVGKYALEEGEKIPTRSVQSAKSWLCHAHAARKLEILPVEACEKSGRISPVEATARYLNHLRQAWNYLIAKNDPEKVFEEQEIVVTVPASFDEVARILTLEAAKQAGYPSITLLEEPKAAFYYWMACHEEKAILKEGDLVLIVDIGGGTSDFSLISVKDKQFDRVAVGDHLLLGGDNMDEALAHLLNSKTKEDIPWQMLRAKARSAKETLLSENAPEQTRIIFQKKGSSLVQGTTAIDLSRNEVLNLLVDGFFGQYNFLEAAKLKPKSGFRRTELPYEDEPSITKHLASFLHKTLKKPTCVLFNGGALKPKIFREALLKALRTWFDDEKIFELESPSLELAVAKGAAQYGKARLGFGKKIGGGTPRSYYVEVLHNGLNKAFTLLERGAEEEVVVKADQTFQVVPNTPVSFKIFTSHTRLNDKRGNLVAINSLELNPLPALQTVLRYGKTKEPIPATLTAKMSEIGVLELALQSEKTDHLWLLEFQIRNIDGKEAQASKTAHSCDEAFGLDELKPAFDCIEKFFQNPNPAKSLIEQLEKILDKERKNWPLSVLRSFSDAVISQAAYRKSSPQLMHRFWNFAGFCLRPGFGHPMDEFRIRELWKIILEDLSNKETDEIQLQKWICYRRIAGGLSKGQQNRLAQHLLEGDPLKKEPSLKSRSDIHYYSEKMRTLSSLEWLDLQVKINLGKLALTRILADKPLASDLSVLGRVGTRKLFYAAFTQVLPKDIVEGWIEQLLASKKIEITALETLFSQVCSLSHNQELNISKKMIASLLEKFPEDQFRRLHEVLTQEVSFNQEEQEAFLADSLPIGLKIGG